MRESSSPQHPHKRQVWWRMLVIPALGHPGLPPASLVYLAIPGPIERFLSRKNKVGAVRWVKGTCYQAWLPEFDPRDPYIRED